MARIKLTPPPQVLFRTCLTVLPAHVNAAGHLDNAQLLALVSQARDAFLQALDFDSPTNIGGLGIILADAAVQYRSEAFGAEELEFAIGVHEFNRYGCDFFYTVSSRRDQREVARVKNGIVFFDYQHRRMQTMPALFVEAIEKHRAKDCKKD